MAKWGNNIAVFGYDTLKTAARINRFPKSSPQTKSRNVATIKRTDSTETVAWVRSRNPLADNATTETSLAAALQVKPLGLTIRFKTAYPDKRQTVISALSATGLSMPFSGGTGGSS